MQPVITVKEAAEFLGISSRKVLKIIADLELPCKKVSGITSFEYSVARQLFRLKLQSQAISFQIVKGGTGKTSLACSVAVKASLYGLKVLAIDLDQQGNLTSSFGVDAESLPVMVDILAEDYSYEDAITSVFPGLDLLASRIENALIDDVIKLKNLKLDEVYKKPLEKLKEKYDLIVIDCPPNLGQSVAAITLAVDKVVAPVVLENYAMSGLKATKEAIRELQEAYGQYISLFTVINKYNPKNFISAEARLLLAGTKIRIHESQDFPKAIAQGQSIFDNVKNTVAKKDIDKLTRELLGLNIHLTSIQNVGLFNPSYAETIS